MSQSSNTVNKGVNQPGLHAGSRPSEPYFFDVMDPANKGLTATELNDLIHDSFLFIDFNGKTYNKVEVVESLLRGEGEFHTYETSDVRVVNWGQDRAYVQRAVITAKGKFLGLDINGQFRCATMSLRDPDGGWKLFNTQLTRIR